MSASSTPTRVLLCADCSADSRSQLREVGDVCRACGQELVELKPNPHAPGHLVPVERRGRRNDVQGRV